MKSITTLALAFGLFQLAAVGARAADDLFWYTYTIDSVRKVQGYPKIETDSKGVMKILYRTGYQVDYIEFDEKKVEYKVADTGKICCDAKVAMALDKNGDMRALRHDDRYHRIWYLTQKEGKWTSVALDSVGTQSTDFYQMGIAVDKDDVSHVFYPKHAGGAVFMHYRTIDKDGKASEPVVVCPSCGYNGKWANLTLDKDGKPWIAFYQNDKNEIRVATPADTGAAWKVSKVDTTDDNWDIYSGYYADIKPDTGGNFIVGYQNFTAGKIMLASGNTTAGFKLEAVDTIEQRTLFTTTSPIATDGKGNVFMAYYRSNKVSPNRDWALDCDLWFASRRDGVWKKQAVDTLGIVGEYASLTILPNGMPAIAYYDGDKGRLKVAVAHDTAPTDSDNDGIPDYREDLVGVRGKAALLRPAPSGDGRVDALGRRLLQGAGRFFKKFTF